MTSPAEGRGGSTPPRPVSGGGPQQWFVLRPWLSESPPRSTCCTATRAPAQPLPVMAWARAYGMIPSLGSSPQSVPLIGPGPGFDPDYALTTDLDDPVISGQPAPLLIDGCHRLYKAAPARPRAPALPRAHRRRDPVHPPPGDPHAPPRPRPAASPQQGEPVMTTITVTIWHNVAVDGQGHHTGMLDGYQPGDPMVRVFTYQADPAGPLPEDIAAEAFAICNGHPRDTRGADLASSTTSAGCGHCRWGTSWPSARSHWQSGAPPGGTQSAAA